MARTSVRYTAAVLLIVAPVIALALLEGAGRAYLFLVYGVEGKSYGIYRAHPVLGGILAGNSYNRLKQFNDRAFQHRENVLEPRPDGSLRVVTYGGSTTFAYNLPTGQDWPSQLEARLRSDDPTAQVLNAGDVMWSLGHINVRTREEFAALRPDYVFLYSGINEEGNADLLRSEGVDFDAGVAAGDYGRFTHALVQANVLFRNSVVYKIFFFWVAPLFGDREQGALREARELDRAALENYRMILADVIDYWRANGARVVFVIQANGQADNPRNVRLTRYSRLGAPVARAHGAIVLDGRDVVDAFDGPPGALFASTGLHWNKEGSDRFAEYLYQQVFMPWIARTARSSTGYASAP